MGKIKVGVKLCGHCNPLADGLSIVSAVGATHNGLELVHWEDPDKDVLLIFSACPSNCVSKPDFSGPIIIVTDSTINGAKVSAQQMPEAIVEMVLAERNSDS